MGQLDNYPRGLLQCQDHRADPSGYRHWHGNDCMILGFMQAHMFSSESQYIVTCATSADAYNLLQRRHEKRSGLTQIQLIQKMMQIRFDNNPVNCDSTMATLRDLIY